jgi:hypothetical protein
LRQLASRRQRAEAGTASDRRYVRDNLWIIRGVLGAWSNPQMLQSLFEGAGQNDAIELCISFIESMEVIAYGSGAEQRVPVSAEFRSITELSAHPDQVPGSITTFAFEAKGIGSRGNPGFEMIDCDHLIEIGKRPLEDVVLACPLECFPGKALEVPAKRFIHPLDALISFRSIGSTRIPEQLLAIALEVDGAVTRSALDDQDAHNSFTGVGDRGYQTQAQCRDA